MILGIDPGVGGALALYDHKARKLIQIDDMPSFSMVIGKSTRRRINAVDLLGMFELYKFLGCELVVIEAVGGRPKQTQVSGYVLGYTVGLIYMACIAMRLPIETSPATVWKKVMKLPGKLERGGEPRAKSEEAIIARADELFPEDRQRWRGPKGGKLLDRAEAALLAKYGGDYLYGSLAVGDSLMQTEAKGVYRKAETGA